MEFDDVLEQVLTLLERDKRRSYRGIKRRFGLDDEYLENLKEECLFSLPEISEPDGRGLISVPTLDFPTVQRITPTYL